MRKISKKVLSIFMCTIFSVLTLFTASAVLPEEIRTHADTFYKQHCEFSPKRRRSIEGLRRWKLRVFGYLQLINGTSKDKVIVPEFILYLASKITGNQELKNIEVGGYDVFYYSDMGKAGSIMLDFVSTLGQAGRIIL